MPGVTSEIVASKMKKARHSTLTKEELLRRGLKMIISKEEKSLAITAGAGDIDKLVEPVKQMIVNEECEQFENLKMWECEMRKV